MERSFKCNFDRIILVTGLFEFFSELEKSILQVDGEMVLVIYNDVEIELKKQGETHVKCHSFMC